MRRSLFGNRRALSVLAFVTTSGLLAVACADWTFDGRGGRAGQLLPTGPSAALSWTGTDHAQTPFYIDPSIPPAGLDTEWQRLVDGAGNPGPVRVRLTFVYPFPGAEIDPAPVINGEGPPGRVFHYVAEACMDAVPNPQNNPLLLGAHVRGYWSADGLGPINRRSDSAVSVIQAVVLNGTCTTMRRIPPEWGGVHGAQWVFFDPPGAKYLMFGARYGLTSFFTWSDAACPSTEEIQASRPECLLRSAHSLGYQWVAGTPSLGSPYDGQWAGNGTGTSSGSTPARADVTFEAAEGVISRFTIRFSIDSLTGGACGGTSAIGGGRISNGAFTISGGNTFVMTINGTFASPETANGTIQIAPGASAGASCLPATIPWTALKGATPAPSPTTTIGGRVTDAATGQPLSGVTAEVVGTGIRATTDAVGVYRLAGIGAVTFAVRYSRQGYATLDREYTLMLGTERLDLDTRLSPTASSTLSRVTIPAP